MACSKCEKCQMCQKSTHRTDEEKKRLTKRLNIIEGQVRGVKQMIENDRYCDDVLTQLSAINKALESLENSILENHIATCVTYEIQSGNLDIIEEVMDLIKKIEIGNTVIRKRGFFIMESIELNVEGMHCTGCSTRLQKVLSNLDGVSKAEVSFETGIAKIEYDSKLKAEDIKSAIVDAGFKVK